MSWTLKRKAQALLAAEEGAVRKDWGGRVAFALVYPNTYAVGMSNLGFQTIYQHLNALPDVVCERVFLPDPEDLPEYRRTGTPPLSLESKRPLSEFDFVGFSITYEGDYIHTLRLLRMAGIPLDPAARRPEDPIVLMGGVCAFANPEPVAPFMDFVVVGEGEEIVGEIVAAYRETFGGKPWSERQREAVALAKREQLPDFVAEVSYWDAHDGPNRWMVTGKMTLPWLAAGKYRAKVAAEAAGLRRTQAELEARRNDTLFAVRDLLIRLKTSEALIEVYQKGIIAQAEQALESARIAYTAVQQARKSVYDWPILLGGPSS